MESPDLNNPPPDEAAFETWLRSQAARAPLPDDGFANRVMAALPTPAAERKSGRTLVCALGALAGLIVLANGNAAGEILPGWQKLAALASDAQAGQALAIALGVTTFSLWYAFRDRHQLLPRL